MKHLTPLFLTLHLLEALNWIQFIKEIHIYDSKMLKVYAPGKLLVKIPQVIS